MIQQYQYSPSWTPDGRAMAMLRVVLVPGIFIVVLVDVVPDGMSDAFAMGTLVVDALTGPVMVVLEGSAVLAGTTPAWEVDPLGDADVDGTVRAPSVPAVTPVNIVVTSTVVAESAVPVL